MIGDCLPDGVMGSGGEDESAAAFALIWSAETAMLPRTITLTVQAPPPVITSPASAAGRVGTALRRMIAVRRITRGLRGDARHLSSLIAPGSALWGLLAVIAKDQLGQSSSGYGLMLATGSLGLWWAGLRGART